jgi:hypothetical protein
VPNRRLDIPDEGLDTPYGRLYRPRATLHQLGMLVIAFAGGPLVGWAVGRAIGDLSETAAAILWLPYALVFFLGYALWLARLNALVFGTLGWSALKAVFSIVVRRRRPESLAEVLPSRDRLLEMLVRAQRAGWSFAPVGWAIGLAAGLTAMLFSSRVSPQGRGALVLITTILWGHLLAWLGRRGWLPFPEE